LNDFEFINIDILIMGTSQSNILEGATETVSATGSYEGPSLAVVRSTSGAGIFGGGIIGGGENGYRVYGGCDCDTVNSLYKMTFHGGDEPPSLYDMYVKLGGDVSEARGFFGGAFQTPVSSLRDYESSVSAKMKEEIIRKLARALKDVGLDVNPDDDLDKIVKDMKKNIPNPSKGRTFAADAESHEKICKSVAEVLNSQFSPNAKKNSQKFIDTNMSATEICRQVGEWVHTFNIGVNTEFLAVYASVQHALRNIIVLDAIMDQAFANIEKKIGQHHDTTLSADTKVFRELYEKAKQSSAQQKELLKNILNINMPPAFKELELVMAEESDQRAVIKKMGLKPGSAGFSDKLAFTISSIGTSAAVAQKVHEALKELNISVNEYLSSEDYKQFNQLIRKKFKKITADSLLDFIKAAKILLSNFSDKENKEFKNALKEFSGASELSFDYDFFKNYVHGGVDDDGDETYDVEDGVEGNFAGGDPKDYTMHSISDLLYGIDDKERKSELETKMDRTKKEKVIIIRDFVKRMSENYDNMAKAANNLGRMFGDSIKFTPQTDNLRNNISKLREVDAKSIELALIGYYSDAQVREVKEKYINNLRMIITLIDEITESNGKNAEGPLAEFKNAMVDIITTIDIYSDALNKKRSITLDDDYTGSNEKLGGCGCAIGGEECCYTADLVINEDSYDGGGKHRKHSKHVGVHPGHSSEIMDFDSLDFYGGKQGGSCYSEGELMTGGLDISARTVEVDLEALQPEFNKSQFSLNNGIQDFLYFYYIAKVRHTLATASKLTEESGSDKYMETLGDSVANEISKLYDQKENILKKITDDLVKKARNDIRDADTTDKIRLLGLAGPPALPPPAIPIIHVELGEYKERRIPGTTGSIHNLMFDNPPKDWNYIPPVGDLAQFKYVEYFDSLRDANIIANCQRLHDISPELCIRYLIAHKGYIKMVASNLHILPDYSIVGLLSPDYDTVSDITLNNITPDLVNNGFAALIKIINNLLNKEPTEPAGSVNKGIMNAFLNSMELIPEKRDQFRKNMIIGRGETYTGGANDDPLAYLNTFCDTSLGTDLGAADSVKQARVNNMVTSVRSAIEKDFDVKINLYKVVQAIDIYLKEFSVAIAKNPKAIQNIVKILDSTQVIANWFNEETGDNLCKAFECMGSTSFNDTYTQVEDIYHGPADSEKIVIVEEMNKNSKEHYYKTLHKVSTEEVAANMHRCLPANPFIGVPITTDQEKPNRGKMARSYLASSVDNFQALKNLVNAFIRIGDEFGGVELRRRIFMTPNQIYKYLIDYIKHSTFFVNYGTGETGPNEAFRMLVPEYYMSFSSATDNRFNNFETENKYFQMIIKAMSAKILVVLGVYDMFNHRQEKVNGIDPVRVILGGTEPNIQNVTAIPEATELYFRLPRLAEFYRHLLLWRGDSGDSQKISFIPELNGAFAGFIRLVFHKMYAPQEGNYSDYDTKNIIYEINYIYNYFKKNHGDKSESLCQHIIHVFVNEINKHIGVIKADEMKRYWDLQKKLSSKDGYGINDSADTNYAILPDETEDYDQSGSAPSDRYLYHTKSDKPRKPIVTKEIKMTDNKRLIKNFRNDLETMFDQYGHNVPRNDFGVTYSTLIKDSETEMKKHTDNPKRLDVAMRLIQTTKELSIESDKAMMFHETVVMGLNALGSVYNIIMNFKSIIELLNPVDIEHKIISAFLGKGSKIYKLLAAPNNAYDAFGTVGAAGIMNVGPFYAHGLFNKHLDKYENFVVNTSKDLFRRIMRDKPIADVKLVDVESVIGAVLSRVLCVYDAAAAPPAFLPPFVDVTHSESKIKEDLLKNTLPSGGTNQDIIYRRLIFTAKLLTNYPLIMKTLLENVFNFVNDELISVRIVSDTSMPFQFDFSNLVSTVEGLINDVKQYINKFRPLMKHDIIERFEKKDNVGSVYWFEEKFIDELFKGKGADTTTGYESGTLNEITYKVNEAYRNLTRNLGIDFSNIFNAGFPVAGFPNIDALCSDMFSRMDISLRQSQGENREWYGSIISEILYYNNSDLDNNDVGYYKFYENDPHNRISSLSAVFTFTGINRLLHLSRALGDGTTANTRVPINTDAAAAIAAPFNLLPNLASIVRDRKYALWDANNYISYKSLLFSFNQILALFLKSCTDTNFRIYSELISSYTGSTASAAVSSPFGNTFPDMCNQLPGVGAGALPVNPQFNRRGDPKPHAIIMTSLAIIMQRLTTDMHPRSQTYDYLVDSLTKVPTYMQDRYRNSICYISKLLKTLIYKGEFYKNVIQKTNINCSRISQRVKTDKTAHVVANAVVVYDVIDLGANIEQS
jgi:hypothetical protein